MSTTHTVILGSGIIGLSTAFFLTESGNTDPKSIVLLDSSAELFHCASGFAGGFCAKDCGFTRFYLVTDLRSHVSRLCRTKV
jgi:glycine/D-amino acid oxidase-like deaminating enzyme